MKKISFRIMKEETYDVITESGVEQKTRQVLEPMTFVCPLSTLNQNIAFVSSIAYNGEYTIEDNGVEPTVEEQITSLKTQLSSTDYKIIKCSEAQLLGEELPYDIASLHAERQALRDKINELEQQLEANIEGGVI